MPDDKWPELRDRIRAEIRDGGPMPFERFMQLALYAPDLGYYVRERNPFGARGDFYTAEQLQPVFGILIGQFISSLRSSMPESADFEVVELGAGRGEMRQALAGLSYRAVEVHSGEFPSRMTGVVFANEFFDALPVHVAVRRDAVFHQQSVAMDGDDFRFVDGDRCHGMELEYLERHYGGVDDGAIVEVHLRGLEWLDRIAETLRGYLLVIDYGYTAREFPRHRDGTLMSYHRHTASTDVLSDPGSRDITAHVPFTVFRDRLEQRGFTVEPLQTLASFLLRAGEPDQFAAALNAADGQESMKRRMQLKTLLYSMGETFRVLLAKSARQ